MSCSAGGAEVIRLYDQEPKYYCTLSLGPYGRPNSFSGGNFRTQTEIVLPIPQELRDDTGVGYTNVDLGATGDILNVQGTSLAARIAARAGLNAADNLGRRVGLSNVGTAAEQVAGGIINPNPVVAFQGQRLRDFQLTWTFQPTNERESRNAQKIIAKLKAAALPKNAIKGQGALLEYPYLVQPNFYPWDNGGQGSWGWSDRSIIRIKRCFMEAVNVSYNPSNTPSFFHKTENPVVILVSITFKEAEYFLSRDWGGGEGNIENISDFFQSTINQATEGLSTVGTALQAEAQGFVSGTLQDVRDALTGGDGT